MKFILKRFLALSFALSVIFLIIPDKSASAAYLGGEASQSVHTRWVSYPGEPTYFDPKTGVEFNPISGKILNFSSFNRYPGEPVYVHKNANATNKYVSFHPDIYKQYVVNKNDIVTKEDINKKNTTSGFTVYVGFSAEAGIAGWGATSTYDLAVSYDKSQKKIVTSLRTGAGAKTAVIGEDFSIGAHVGFSTKNQTSLSGPAIATSVSIPWGELTISGSDGILRDTLEIEVQGGTSFAFTGQDLTWNKSWKISEFSLY